MTDAKIINEFRKINHRVDELIVRLSSIIKIIPELTFTVNALSTQLNTKGIVTQEELTNSINTEIDKLKPKDGVQNA